MRLKLVIAALLFYTLPLVAQISSNAPELRFNELDQVGAAGRWRLNLSGDVFKLEKNTAVAKDFSTVITPLSVSNTGVVTFLNTINADVFSTPKTSLVQSGNYRGEVYFDTTGALVAAPWRLSATSGGTSLHDNVLVLGYNVRYNQTTAAWERTVSGEHAIRQGYESRWVAGPGDPAVLRGQFEWNLDVDSSLTGAINFNRRPWGLYYVMDAPQHVAIDLGDLTDVADNIIHANGKLGVGADPGTNAFYVPTATGNTARINPRLGLNMDPAGSYQLDVTGTVGVNNGGIRVEGTYTVASPVLLDLAANLATTANAYGLVMQYNAIGTGSSAVGAVYGIQMNAGSWTKGTSNTITNAYGINVTAPTIASNNYSIYADGTSLLVPTTGYLGIGTTSTTATITKVQIGANANLKPMSDTGQGFTQYPTTKLQISGSTTTAATAVIGLNLENTSATNNTFSPLITFSRFSASNNYNPIFATIGGLATGNGDSTNWVAGSLVFATASSAASGAYERVRINENGVLISGTTGDAQTGIGQLQELVTLVSGHASDATTIQIPANCIVLGVDVRVKVAPATTANFTVTGTTSSTAFQTGVNVAATLNNTDVGTKACPYLNTTAQTITLTYNAAPTDSAGRVRVTIHYIQITAATS